MEEFAHPVVIPGYQQSEFFVCNTCRLEYFAKEPIDTFGSDCVNKIKYRVTFANNVTEKTFSSFDDLRQYMSHHPQNDCTFELSCDLSVPFWGSKDLGNCGLPRGKITNIDDLKVWTPIPEIWKDREIERIDDEMGSLQKKRRVVDNLEDM